MNDRYLEERLESLPVEEWVRIPRLYKNGFCGRKLTKEEISKLRVEHYRNVGEELDRPNTSHPRQSNIICYGQPPKLEGIPIPPEQAKALICKHFANVGPTLERMQRDYEEGLYQAPNSTVKEACL